MRQKGLSLVELMVGIVLLMFGGLLVVELIRSTTRATGFTTGHALAHLRSASILDLVSSMVPDAQLPAVDAEGVFVLSEADRRLLPDVPEIQLQAETIRLKTAGTGLLAIWVTVDWRLPGERRTHRDAAFRLVYRPDQSWLVSQKLTGLP
jgi:hypothetical protein